MQITDKLWSLIPLEELEQEAQDQIWKVHGLDQVTKLVIMPDSHKGYTLPIGGIALCDKAISPVFVGYDVSCGMCHVQTTMPIEMIQNRVVGLRRALYRQIPVGFKSRYKEAADIKYENILLDKESLEKVNDRLNPQVGTLGGGK